MERRARSGRSAVRARRGADLGLRADPLDAAIPEPRPPTGRRPWGNRARRPGADHGQERGPWSVQMREQFSSPVVSKTRGSSPRGSHGRDSVAKGEPCRRFPGSDAWVRNRGQRGDGPRGRPGPCRTLSIRRSIGCETGEPDASCARPFLRGRGRSKETRPDSHAPRPLFTYQDHRRPPGVARKVCAVSVRRLADAVRHS